MNHWNKKPHNLVGVSLCIWANHKEKFCSVTKIKQLPMEIIRNVESVNCMRMCFRSGGGQKKSKEKFRYICLIRMQRNWMKMNNMNMNIKKPSIGWHFKFIPLYFLFKTKARIPTKFEQRKNWKVPFPF